MTDIHAAKFQLDCAIAHELTTIAIHRRMLNQIDCALATGNHFLFLMAESNEKQARQNYYNAVDKKYESLFLYFEAQGWSSIIVFDLWEQHKRDRKGDEHEL